MGSIADSWANLKNHAKPHALAQFIAEEKSRQREDRRDQQRRGKKAASQQKQTAVLAAVLSSSYNLYRNTSCCTET